MTDLIPDARPVPSTEDRMRDARTDTTDRSFAAYLTATDRAQLDARAACAEQERDDARDDLQELKAHHADLHTRLNTTENDLRSQNRAVLELAAERDRARADRDRYARTAADLLRQRNEAANQLELTTDERDRHRQELGAAGEVLAVVRDAAERIERALAVYDTTPGEPTEREDTPHEDPARLREQLAEAHADCARYATERDEARAALANPLHKAAEHLRLLAEDHGLDSLGFGIGWAADALDAWAKTPDEAAPPSSVPPRRVQEEPTDRRPSPPRIVPYAERAPLYAAYKAAREWAEQHGESYTDDGIIQAAVRAYEAERRAQADKAEARP